MMPVRCPLASLYRTSSIGSPQSPALVSAEMLCGSGSISAAANCSDPPADKDGEHVPQSHEYVLCLLLKSHTVMRDAEMPTAKPGLCLSSRSLLA